MSVTSSIRYGVYENGRRYHSMEAGRYILPNDREEQDRFVPTPSRLLGTRS